MNKLKAAVLLIFTVLLLGVGLLLPSLTTQAVDSMGRDAIYAEPMTFPVPNRETQPSLDTTQQILEKFSILDKNALVPLADQVSSRAPEELEALMEPILRSYESNLLVAPGLSAHPPTLYLCVDPSDPTSYLMLWLVRYTNTAPSDEFHDLQFWVDDESGMVFHVSYSTTTAHEDVEGRMNRLTQLYFSGLGLNGNEYYTLTDPPSGKNSYLCEYYTLPMMDGIETQLFFEMDLYYFNTNTTRYRVEVIEP